MKRTLILFLTLILCLSALSGCGGVCTGPDKGAQGSSEGSSGGASQTTGESSGEDTPAIEYTMYVSIADRLSFAVTYLFLSQENAQCRIGWESPEVKYSSGTYELTKNALTLRLEEGHILRFSVEDDAYVFDKANSVFEMQEDEEAFEFSDGAKFERIDKVRGNQSGITVSSGDSTVSPISGMLYTDLYDEDLGGYLSGSGNGVSGLLSALRNVSNPYADAFLPSLTLDGEITVSLSANESITHVDLIALGDPETGVGKWEESSVTLEDLNTLPAGKYYVILTVLSLRSNGADLPPDKYCYEDIFRLTVEG